MHIDFRQYPFLIQAGVALSLAAWISAAQAQGQGSYGGIADGFVGLFRVALLVGVAVVLLVVRFALGKRAALGLIAVLAVGYFYLLIESRFSEAKRLTTYKKIERAFAEGCAKTSRVIVRPTTGDEHIFIRLKGAENIPEYQQSNLVPRQDRVAKGVEVSTNLPVDTSNAILIDIQYSRDLVPGSYSGYEWHRTRYDLTVRSLADGALIAQTMDMEARTGFCLDGLEAFLQQVLSRPSVLWANDGGRDGQVGPRPPNAYVQAEYSQTSGGTYLQTSQDRDSFANVKELLSTKNCTVKESTISPPLALCDDSSQGTVEVPLYGIVGLHSFGNSWLLIYRVDKGMTPLTSLRVERRLADWRLARVWTASVVPPPGNVEGREYLEGFAVDGDTLTASVYWDRKLDFSGKQISSWYAHRSMLRIPLPGLGP